MYLCPKISFRPMKIPSRTLVSICFFLMLFSAPWQQAVGQRKADLIVQIDSLLSQVRALQTSLSEAQAT